MTAVPPFDEAIRAAGYVVVGPPFRGGMSTVFPATPAAASMEPAGVTATPTVAVKVLHDGGDAARLRREADLLASVDHPSIARFVEVGELATGDVFLVAAWAPGSTLHSLLVEQDRLSRADSLAVFDSIADGLEHLHHQGIVHRDLSPKNVLVELDTTPQATLIDFGISRGATSDYQTVGSELAGTPRYLAPEVISGADPSPASDQFAAAIVLYEMLTGSWPYPESPTAANALHHQLSTLPTPLIESIPDAPPELDQALQRALSKDPDQRFPSMNDFARAAHGVDTAGNPVADRQRRTSSRLATAGGLAAVSVIALLAIVLWANRSDDAEFVAVPTSLVANEPVTGDWSAGDAEALACNVLTFVDFDDRVLPTNWYLNPIDEAGVDVVSEGGQDDTPALRIGFGERYGLWGEVVDVEPGETYVFAGTFLRVGEPFVANISIEWYDIDSNVVVVDTPTVDLTRLPNGRAALRSTAPADARFAVAQVFKDASEGSLLADELVLVRADDPCAEGL